MRSGHIDVRRKFVHRFASISKGKEVMQRWQGTSAQFVWFVTESEKFSAESAFSDLWGEQPDQLQRNRVPGPSAPFFARAATEKEGILHQVLIGAGRIDAVVAAVPYENDPFGQSFDMQSTLQAMSDAAKKSKLFEGEVYRLSVVATLLSRVANYEESADHLYKMIGYDPALGPVSDLIFQLNKRTSYKSFEINRLINLSTMAAQGLSVEMAPGIGVRHAHGTLLALAARRQFDFNTVPNGKLFDLEMQADFFQFLVSEIFRIAESESIQSLAE